MNDEFTKIDLLLEETLFQTRGKFKYLHVGFVQVALKPIFKEGLDVFVYLALRDKRISISLHCYWGLFNQI